MRMKRILGFLLVAFAIFFLVSSPSEAAKLVKATGESAGEWFSTAADSLSTFLKQLI